MTEKIDHADWMTAKMLKNSIKTLTSRNDPKYTLNIDQEKRILNVFINKFTVKDDEDEA